jgi:phosphoglycolate phosphatase-like HAD superfamily hydrolase
LVLAGERLIFTIYESLDGNSPELFEGTREVLWQLREEGIELFLSSGSKSSSTKIRLEKAGLDEFFTLVVGSELPKREHIPYLAQSLGLSLEDFASQAFLIGDGWIDMVSGIHYGLYSIGITNTLSPDLLRRAGAKEVISSLREFLE